MCGVYSASWPDLCASESRSFPPCVVRALHHCNDPLHVSTLPLHLTHNATSHLLLTATTPRSRLSRTTRARTTRRTPPASSSCRCAAVCGLGCACNGLRCASTAGFRCRLPRVRSSRTLGGSRSPVPKWLRHPTQCLTCFPTAHPLCRRCACARWPATAATPGATSCSKRCPELRRRCSAA